MNISTAVCHGKRRLVGSGTRQEFRPWHPESLDDFRYFLFRYNALPCDALEAPPPSRVAIPKLANPGYQLRNS